MASGQIVTLQAGPSSNYVGAHFWNIKDEELGYSTSPGWADINHDTFFSQLESPYGEVSYKPRLVLFDFASSLGGWSLQRPLQMDSVVSNWNEGVERFEAPRQSRSSFLETLDEDLTATYRSQQEADEAAGKLQEAAQQLDSSDGVKFWTDFIKADIHPRSLHALPSAWAAGRAFDDYGDGAKVLEGEEAREEAVDRVRYFLEACDAPQGFQALVDGPSGWSRVMADLLTDVRDDNEGLPVLLYSIRPLLQQHTQQHGRQQTDGNSAAHRHALSEALAMTRFSELADLLIPLTAPSRSPRGLSYQPQNAFHSSALLGAAVETISLPFCLKGGAASGAGAVGLHAWVRALRHGGSNLAAAHLQLPAPPLAQESQVLDARVQRAQQAGPQEQEQHQPPATLQLQGGVCLTEGVADEDCELTRAEALVLRGGQAGGTTASAESCSEALATLWQQQQWRRPQLRCIHQMPIPIPLPYPQLFRPIQLEQSQAASNASTNRQPGGAHTAGHSSGGVEDAVESCAVMTKVQATGKFQEVVRSWSNSWRRSSSSALGRTVLEKWGVGRGDAAEVEEQLANMAYGYEDGHDDDM